MAEGYTCRRCGRAAEVGEAAADAGELCEQHYLEMAALDAMKTCHKLDVESAIAESKRPGLLLN